MNSLLAVGDSNNKVYLWGAASATLRTTLTDPAKAAVTSVALSPNGKLVAAGDVIGHIRIWPTGS